jgi:hypothetical protein
VVQYKLIFLGLSVVGPDEELRLLKGLQKKFSLSPERAERLLEKVPIVVKKGSSREEMEKYMRAFQEIGGKVRLEEEEPFPEFQGVSGEPEAEKPAYAGRMITCPQCSFEQPETDECVKCGLVFSRYAPYQEMAKFYQEKPGKIPSEGKEIPWESGEGFLGAFFNTAKTVLFSPARFFRQNGAEEGYGSPLLYGLIVGIIGLGGSMVWQWFFFANLFEFKISPALPYSLQLIGFTLALPLMVLLSIFLGSVVTHFCLIVVGGNKMGFQQTLRAVSYSYTGQLFGMIPVIGSTIGSIYTVILTIIGVKEGHGISTGRAIFAVLLPFILVAGLLIIAAIFIPLFLGSLRFVGGVSV